jgi:hypothetical protein
MMAKLVTGLFLLGSLSACQTFYSAPQPNTVPEPNTSVDPQTSNAEKSKEAADSANEAMQAKCQDAKMDLLAAEGNNDMAQANIITKRIIKYCDK